MFQSRLKSYIMTKTNSTDNKLLYGFHIKNLTLEGKKDCQIDSRREEYTLWVQTTSMAKGMENSLLHVGIQ
jgi:hypothetical protein